LLYESENWAIKARDATRIRTAEIKDVEKQQDTVGQIIKQIQRLQGS